MIPNQKPLPFIIRPVPNPATIFFDDALTYYGNLVCLDRFRAVLCKLAVIRNFKRCTYGEIVTRKLLAVCVIDFILAADKLYVQAVLVIKLLINAAEILNLNDKIIIVI